MKKILPILTALILACFVRSEAQDVTILASDETVCEGGTVTVEISVENFTNVSAMSFPIVWDTDVLSYVSHEVQVPPLIPIFGVNSTNAASGSLSFSWLDPSAPFNFSLGNGAVILTVTFTAVGTYTVDNISTVSLQSTPGFPAEVFQNGGITPAPAVFTDGSVIISDNDPPTIINCPTVPPVTVPFGSGGGNVSWTAPTANDNCDPSPTISPTISPGSFFPVGTTTVEYIAEDAAGNMSLPCQFDVEVMETPSPGAFTFIASNDTLSCNDTTASVTISVENFDDVEGFQFAFVWDTSIISFDSLVPAPFPNANGALGANQAGAPGGLLLVNWVDFTSMGIDFPNGEEILTVYFSVDVDSLVAAGFTMAEFQSLPFYQIIIATNAGGQVPSSNIATINSTISFDDAPPVINDCPPALSNPYVNDVGQCGAVVSWTEPTADDECDGALTPIRTGDAPGSLFPVGTTTITYSVTDSKNQTTECSFDIVVEDEEAPTATCPASIADVVLDTNGNGILSANIGDGSSMDNCGTAIETSPSLSFTCADLGVQMVTLAAEDPSGNNSTADCSFNVVDNENPTGVCPAAIADVELDGSGNGTLPADIGDGSSTDNCGTVIETSPSLSFTCADLGIQMVTLTVEDGSGNTSTAVCSFNVVDNTNPTATCPATIADVVLDGSGNGTLPADIGDGSSTDNCGPVTETSPSLSFTCADLGVQMVTLTAEDGSGNSATVDCSFNVVDNLAPTATCPATIADVVLDGSGNGTLPANVGDGSSTDNCGLVTETSPSLTLACADLGVQTVTLTAEDGSGNTSTVDCSFNVVDNENPTAVCPAAISDVELDASGNGTLPADIGDGSSTDNCGTVTETSPSLSFTCADLGVQMVTLTAEDGSGNTSTVDCSFNVVDNTNPTAVCPASIADVVLDGSGNGTLPADIGDGSSTDNCGTVTETSPSLSFTCADLGVQMVTLTAEDGSGNTSTVDCSFSVTENEDPVAICPATIADVELDASGNGILPADIGDGSSTDNCGTVTETSPSLSFTCADLGMQMVTLTAEDGSGNTSTVDCSFNVVDNTNPTAVCPASIADVVLDGSGNGTLPADIGDGSSTDNCGTVTETSPSLSFTCADLGVQMVTLTAEDGSGNTSTVDCSFNVTENEDPVAICPATIADVELDASGNGILPADIGDGSSTDNCGTVMETSPSLSFTCADLGVQTVTLTAEDGSGNSATVDCSFNVVDNLAPTATCPAAIADVVLDGSGNGTLPADIGDGSSVDNCGAVTETSPSLSFTCADLGVQMVTLTAEDGSGNTSTVDCSFNVTENEPPVAVCPAVIADVVLDGSGNGTLPADIGDGSSTDNCGLVTETSPSLSFTCADLGVQTVTLTAEDGSGNSATVDCSFNVIETGAPVAICPATIADVELDASGNGTLPADIGDGSSTDDCGGGSVTETSPSLSFTCADLGVQTVTLTATDGNNNSSTVDCSFNVVDNENPTAVCPATIADVELDASGNGTLAADIGDGSSTDNCSVTETSPSLSFTCADLGVRTVTLMAEDGSGNSATVDCSFNVVDNLAPTATCPTTIADVVLDGSGNGTLPADIGDGSSMDNCGTAIETSPSLSFICVDLGVQTVTLTAEDGSGNTSTVDCSFNVVDNENPLAICPSSIDTVYLDSDGNGTLPADIGDGSSTDNCSVTETSPSLSFTCADLGVQTVTLTATDGSSNSSTVDCSFSVVDSIAPTAICQDADLYLGITGTATIAASLIDGGSFDSCGITSLTTTPFFFDCSNVGANSVTLNVGDASGNTSSCVATVTVIDTIPPTAVCQDATIYLDGSGVASLSAADVDGGSVDSCGVMGVSVSQISFACSDTGDNMVTLTVTDANGNVDSCMATVTVLDTIPPVASCQNDTLYLDASGNASLAPADLENGSTDNCGVDEITASQTDFTCADLGNNFVTVYVTDEADNVDSCMAMVTVQDTIAPTLTCPSDSIIVVPIGTADTVLSGFDLVAFDDNCFFDSIHYVLTGASTGAGSGSVVVSETFNLDTTLVTYYAVDVSGNVDSCGFDVVIVEEEGLILDCPDSVVQDNDTGECSATVTGLELTILAGDAQSVSYEATGATALMGTGDIPDTTFNVGLTTVIYTATDSNNVDFTCTFTVEVQDTTPPILNCPGPLVLGNDPGVCGLEFSVGLIPSASDNCALDTVITSPFEVGDTIAVGGPYDITTIAVDTSGNADTCVYQLTVNDTEPPVWTDCPTNISNVPNDTGECGAIVTWNEPVADDNCAVIAITPPTNPNGSLFPAGEMTLVEYVAVDAAGNAAKCSFTVTVVDAEPPTIGSCPVDISVPNDPNLCSATVTWSIPLPDDNCGVVSFVASGIPAGNEFAVGGPYSIGYSATDEAGNTTICTFTVTVADSEFPEIIGMPTDITIPADPGECSAVVNWTPPTTSDNCGIQSFSSSNNPGETFPVTLPGQPHVVSYTSTDINGNIEIEVFTITVEDDQLPEFDNCPTDNIIVNVDGTTSSPFVTALAAVDCENVQVSFADLTGEDNCAIANIAQTFGPASGSVFSLGINTLTFQATDVNGNQSTCSFNIIVEGLAVAGAQASPADPCEGDEVEFSVANAVPGATYTWKDPLGATVSTQPTFTLPAIALAQSGDFTLEVAFDFCQQEDAVTVEVSENPVIEIDYNDVLCGDGTVPLVLTGINTSGATITEWQWTKPDGDMAFGQTLTINNPTVDDAGFYILQATSDNECVGSAQTAQEVIVSVEPLMPTLTINPQSSICLGESVFLTGEPFTGTDVEYQWSADPLAGSGLPVPAPSNPVIEVMPTEPGTYTYFYTVVVDGCASQMAEVALQVEAAPVVSIDVDGETTCLDGSTDIVLSVNQASGSPITDYFWTPGNSTDPTLTISDATSANADVYSVTVTTDLGCTGSSFVNLTDLTDALTTPTITPDNDAICLGTNTTISSFPAYPSGTIYTWTVNGVVQPSSLPQIIVTPDMEGITDITLVVSLDGCESAVAATQVEALSMGMVNVTVDGQADCLDGTSTVTLIASAAGATSYEWINQGVFDAQLPITNATSQDSGPYEVIARNDVGCVSQATFVLELTDALEPVTAFLQSPACEMQALELCAEPTIDGATYEWTGPNGNIVATTQCPTIDMASDILNGDYTVTATLDGCSSTSEALLVDVIMPPTANNEVVVGIVNQPQSFNVVVNDEIEGDYTISVVEEPGFGSVVYDGDGVFTYTPQAGFRETDRMAYEICYEDCPEACDIAIVTLLIRFPGDDCVATTVITPNNDGINDEFVISCLEVDDYPDNTLSIYNEWGDEVFDAAPYDNTWRGTYEGRDLPDGTYFFVFRREPNVPTQKGFVMIHR